MSDEDLVRTYQETLDQQYLAEVYNRYTALIYGICIRYLTDSEVARDAAADIYEVLEDKLKKFNVVNFSSWLHTLTRNHCLQMLRRSKKENSAFPGLFEEMDMENIYSEHPTNNSEEEMLQRMENSLLQLPAAQLDCLRLFYYRQKSYAEIVDITGFELKKVKSHIQNGKRNLKLLIIKDDGYG